MQMQTEPKQVSVAVIWKVCLKFPSQKERLKLLQEILEEPEISLQVSSTCSILENFAICLVQGKYLD